MKPELLRAWLLLVLLLMAPTTAWGKVCPKGTTTPGIDVSYYQGTINWASVAATGQKFVIARVSDGVNTPDSKFDTYWPAMKKAGFIVGAYQFFRPAQDVIAQADLLLSKMGPMQAGMLPPTLDVEASGGLTPAQVETAVAQWVSYVKGKLGVTPIIYTGAWFWDPSVVSTAQSSLPLWTSNYCSNCCATIPQAWTDWVIWQFSDAGTAANSGIAGCDMDEWNGDLASLQAFADNGAPACATVFDTIGTAKAVTSNTTYSGTSCATGDTDYFSFSGCGAFNATVVANSSSFDCSCAILNSAGTELTPGGAEGYVRNDAYNGSTGCACSVSQASGAYFLKLYANVAGAYSFDKAIPGPCTCVPATCGDFPGACGASLDNGCGGTLDCSSNCATAETCQAGVCQAKCVASQCTDLGKTCGNWSDGCGGTALCGTCGSGLACVAGACQGVGGSCDPCPNHDECAPGLDCRWWDTAGTITFCSVACANGCPSGTHCGASGVWCVPNVSNGCNGNDVWQVDTCGNEVKLVSTCTNGQSCSAGSCASTCSNQCSSAGSKQCSGNGVQTCGDTNGDGCLEWSVTQACGSGSTCQAGSCVSTAVCGNGKCESGESSTTCAADCGAPPNPCGNGVCEMNEDCGSCAADCGCGTGLQCNSGVCQFPPSCGNGTCDAGETKASCCGDCGCPSGQNCTAGGCKTPGFCGDGQCGASESAATCCADCACATGLGCQNNQCVTVCGDGTCSGSETCGNCSADCGCPNGQTCNAGACSGNVTADAGSPSDAAANDATAPGEDSGAQNDASPAPDLKNGSDISFVSGGNDVSTGKVGAGGVSQSGGCSARPHADSPENSVGWWALLVGAGLALRRRAASTNVA